MSHTHMRVRPGLVNIIAARGIILHLHIQWLVCSVRARADFPCSLAINCAGPSGHEQIESDVRRPRSSVMKCILFRLHYARTLDTGATSGYGSNLQSGEGIVAH